MTVIEPIIDDYDRDEIHKHIARLLRDMGNPNPPLKLEEVRELQKLDLKYYSKSEINFLDEIAHQTFMAGKSIARKSKRMIDLVTEYKIRGMLMLNGSEKKIFIDNDVAKLKRRFLISHEIMHDLLPWHQALLLGDNEETLNPTFHQVMEAEANYGGRRLLFFGGQFQKEALDYDFNWETIKAVSKRYGNTLTITLWHMVCERNPQQPAFGLMSKHPYYPDLCKKSGDNNVAHFSRSKALIDRFPMLTEDNAYAAVCEHATMARIGWVGEGESILHDANGEAHTFTIFSFSNTYDLLTYGIYKEPYRRIFQISLKN